MKTLIICSLIGFSSLTTWAGENCSSEIVEAAKLTDGRQSSNCVVEIRALDVSSGSKGIVDVKCPLFIPGNPNASAPYLAKTYTFTVASDSCDASVEALN